MVSHSTALSALDKAALLGARALGAGLLLLSGWGLWAEPSSSLVWATLWAGLGVAALLLYTPALRVLAFGCLLAAGAVILGGLSPFAAMDVAATTRERPGFALRQVAVMSTASAVLVLAAFCLERARRLKRAQQTPQRSADPKPALTATAKATPPRPH
jgi:hypothetical protein